MKKLSVASRFTKVVEELYDNNLAKAGSALGLDRSTVSRYVSGRNPPLCVLLLLSRLRNIDIDWLTEGADLKIRFAKENYSGVVSRPVTDTPCEGVPDHTTPRFRGEFRQVAPFHNVPDRYWLRLHAVVPTLGLIKRDLVLMQSIPPRKVAHADMNCLRVLKRGEIIDVALPAEAEIKSEVQVLAIAHLVERDLQ